MISLPWLGVDYKLKLYPGNATAACDARARIIVFFTLFFWSWLWDFYQMSGQYHRVGRLKVFLFGALALAALKLSKSWHWSIGILYFYIGFVWVQQAMPPYGTIEMVMITATLFAIPEIYKNFSLRSFENMILLSALGHALIGVFNTQGIYPFLPMNNADYLKLNAVSGLMGQHTILSPFLCFAFAISLHRLLEERRHYLYGGLSALLFILILLCKSSMGYASLGACLLVYILFYMGVRITLLAALGIASVILLAAYLDPSIGNFSGREEPWRDAWSLTKNRPWLGYGIGSWSVMAERIAELRKYPIPWTQLHHEPLQGLFELGRIGMILASIFCLRVMGSASMLYLFNQKERIPYIAGVALFSVNSLGNFTLHIVPNGPLFAFCLYVVLCETRRISSPPWLGVGYSKERKTTPVL